VGTDEEAIVEAVTELMEDATAYGRMAHSANPYGDGLASQRIVKAIFDASDIRTDGVQMAKAADVPVLVSAAEAQSEPKRPLGYTG
jgi:UDP-N-acetylglucosamine 2-epimerase